MGKHTWGKYSVRTCFIPSTSVTQVYAPQSSSIVTYNSDYMESGTTTMTGAYLSAGVYFRVNDVDYKFSSRQTNYFVNAYPVTYETRRGDYVDNVESDNSAAYPENGAQDGYWYVYIGSEEIFEPSVFATIDGVQRKLTAIPAKVDGVQRELSKLFATVDGVAREIFSAGSGGSLISFTIDGTAYQSEDGMTWGEWVNSGYNTGGFYINGGNVGFSDNKSLVANSSLMLTSQTSVIEAGHAYIKMG